MHVFFFLFLSVRVSAEGCVRSLSLCCYTSTLSPLFLWFHETGTIVTDAYKYIYVCKCWECTKKKDKQTHRQKKKKKRCSSTTSAAISFMMGEWSCVTLRVAFAFFFCVCVCLVCVAFMCRGRRVHQCRPLFPLFFFKPHLVETLMLLFLQIVFFFGGGHR